MLERLAPFAQKIGTLGADVTVEFTCAVHRKKAPALHFDKNDLRWLALMGAKLDVDTFVIADAPKPAAHTDPAAPKASFDS